MKYILFLMVLHVFWLCEIKYVLFFLLQTLEICLTTDQGREAENSSDQESPATGTTTRNIEPKNIDCSHPLKIKTGLQKRPAGFQATLICVTTAPSGEQPENITSLSLNSSYGL